MSDIPPRVPTLCHLVIRPSCAREIKQVFVSEIMMHIIFLVFVTRWEPYFLSSCDDLCSLMVNMVKHCSGDIAVWIAVCAIQSRGCMPCLQIEKSIAYTSGQSDYIDELRQIQNLTSRVVLLYAT